MAVLAVALLGAVPHLRLVDCAEFDDAVIRSTLAVELSGAPPDGGPDVEARCSGQRVVLRRSDAAAGSPERSLDFSAIAPEARSRMLGIAVAELMLLSRTGSEPPAQAPARPTERASRLLVEGALSYAGRGLWLWGGGLRWSWERPRVFGLELDARLEHGVVAVSAGHVVAERATVGVAGHARLELAPLTLRALGGLRGGAVRMAGVAATPAAAQERSGLAGWLGCTLGIAAALALGPASLELGIDAGIPLVGVVALVDGAPAAGLDGFSIGARLAVGLFP